MLLLGYLDERAAKRRLGRDRVTIEPKRDAF
jgi:hypothetical protein